MDTLPRPIKGIFIDLDDTLYAYPPCNSAGKQAVVEFLSAKLNLPANNVGDAIEAGRRAAKEHLRQSDRELASSHSRLLYIQNAIEELTGRTNAKLTLECERIFWDTFYGAMRLLPGARELLERANGKKVKTVIVTDMTAQQQLQKLVHLDIDSLIDFVISSEESGFDKPHPASFRLALSKSELDPNVVIMIGEDEQRDGLSARTLGITPVLIHKQPKDNSLLFGKDFHELLNLIGGYL